MIIKPPQQTNIVMESEPCPHFPDEITQRLINIMLYEARGEASAAPVDCLRPLASAQLWNTSGICP